jgi:hypothetical protein
MDSCFFYDLVDIVYTNYSPKIKTTAPIKRPMSRGNTSPVIKSLAFLHYSTMISPLGFASAPVVSLYGIVTKQ